MSHLNQYAKAVWVYAIHHTLEREGVDSAELFASNNFEFNSLRSIHDDVPRSLVNALWKSAIEQTQNDAFCLKTLDFINEPFINALVSVTRASPSVRDALSILQKFHTLISPELRLDIETNDQLSIKVWNVDHLGEWLPEDRDITLAIIAKHGLAIAAKEIKPRALQLTRSKPTCYENYRALFDCDIEFNADENCIRYPIEVLDIQIPSANPHMFGYFQEYLDKSLKQQKGLVEKRSLKEKLEDFMASSIEDENKVEFPSLAACAEHFHMSQSAFKKHLQNEGVRYQVVADHVRRDHACHLIRQGHHSFKEIAFRLGFANSSAFNKAFKRWTEQSPKEYAESANGNKTNDSGTDPLAEKNVFRSQGDSLSCTTQI